MTDAPPPGSIDIAMTCCPKFIPKKATANAGTVVFFLHNEIGTLSAPHNFMIGESLDGPPLAASPTLSPRQSVAFTVFDLPAGTYTYWCTIPSPDGKSHASYGMVGTLTVRS